MDFGRPETVTLLELEESILDALEDLSNSTRKMVLRLEISLKTVWKILKNLLYTYHIQRIQLY